MEITEVRIKLMDDQQERLQAFCSITFDHCFAIRDLKIIEGIKGSFVAMPSRKLTDRCPECHAKNHLRSMYCNHCGKRLPEERASKADDGRAKLYADIAHPINSRCREMIQARVLQAYQDELVRAEQPGYICTYDDYGEDGIEDLSEFETISLDAARTVSRSIGKPDSTHRIDTAPAAASSAPHMESNQRRSRNFHSVQHAQIPEGEDGFGSGILEIK